MWTEFRVSVIEHCQRFGNCLGLAIPARRMDHCFAPLLQYLPRINKADIAALDALNTAFRQNFDEILPRHIMNSWCEDWCNTRRAALAAGLCGLSESGLGNAKAGKIV